MNVWTGSAGPDFDTPGSWPLGHVAAAGEDLVFGVAEDNGPGPLGFSSMTSPDGEGGGVGGTGADCYGMHPPAGGGAYNSVTLEAVYVGKVTVTGGFSTGDLNLAGGTLDQGTPGASYSNTDITVTGIVTLDTENTHLLLNLPANFTWTAGTLNSTDHLATLHISGATASIDPGDGNALTTGSTLSLENGATADFFDGTFYFNNAADLVVNQLCVAQIRPEPTKKVEFYGTAAAGGRVSTVRIPTGGEIKVLADWDGFEMPLVISGGTLEVMNKVTADFGPIAGGPGARAFIQQTAGTIKLHSEATLSARPAVNGYTSITGGDLIVVADSPSPATAPALIKGTLEISNANITFTGNYWTLQVDGNVVWADAVFKPRANLATTNLADRLDVTGVLDITNGKRLKIEPQPQNAQNGFPQGFSPIIISAIGGITRSELIQILPTTPAFTHEVSSPGGTEKRVRLFPG